MQRAGSPGDQLDKLLTLKVQMERSKALYEAVKEEYDRALAGSHKPSALPIGAVAHHAIQLYAVCLTNYQQATMEFNQYLLDQTFPYDNSAH